MLKTLFFSLLFSALLFGQVEQNYPFVGLSVSTQNINIESEDASWKSAVALKYGQQSQDWRTIFALDYTQDSYFGAQVEIDKILLDNMFGTAKLRPYLGIVAGYMAFDDKNIKINHEETNGFYYGGNFGFIVYATDNVDIDLSYHYYSVQNLDFLDDVHGATLAVHYFF